MHRKPSLCYPDKTCVCARTHGAMRAPQTFDERMRVDRAETKPGDNCTDMSYLVKRPYCLPKVVC